MRVTKSCTWAGSVKEALSASTFTSSSMPARAPSSASTTTPWSWAYSTTFLVISMFSAKGLEEASIMTEVKPPSMQLLQVCLLYTSSPQPRRFIA